MMFVWKNTILLCADYLVLPVPDQSSAQPRFPGKHSQLASVQMEVHHVFCMAHVLQAGVTPTSPLSVHLPVRRACSRCETAAASEASQPALALVERVKKKNIRQTKHCTSHTHTQNSSNWTRKNLHIEQNKSHAQDNRNASAR